MNYDSPNIGCLVHDAAGPAAAVVGRGEGGIALEEAIVAGLRLVAAGGGHGHFSHFYSTAFDI